MYNLCAKFGDFSFSRFGFVMRTNTQTESHADADYPGCPSYVS